MSDPTPPPVPVLDALGCPNCPAGGRFVVAGGAVRCPTCGAEYPIGPHGSVLGHYPLTPEVVRELDGMRHEHPDRFPTVESVVLQPVDRVSTFDERKRASAGSAKDYYLSTEMNFRYAFDRLRPTGAETVLEIGAEHDFPFLRPFAAAGCRTFATNIYYSYAPDQPPPDRVHVVLGDMNRLPYRDGVFDVVLASATTHHSPDLPGLIRELARVTKPGGAVLVLNDPSWGLFKHAFDRSAGHGKKGGERHEMIHENEYSPLAYRRLARRNGLRLVESFFSAYYDQKLRTGRTAGVRFARLGGAVSRVWRWKWARAALTRFGLLPAQLLIGLEINMIFRKGRPPAGGTSAAAAR